MRVSARRYRLHGAIESPTTPFLQSRLGEWKAPLAFEPKGQPPPAALAGGVTVRDGADLLRAHPRAIEALIAG